MPLADEAELTLTRSQIVLLHSIAEEHDCAYVTVEGTNLAGTVVFRYHKSPNQTVLTKLLVNAYGHSMII